MSSSECGYCGGPMHLPREGAKFCTSKCRVYAHRASKRALAFPEAMTVRDRWVRRAANKMPLTAGGRAASSTDSRTWATFADAKASTAGVGLGFVLGDGIGCIDLDHCLEDGKLSDWAAEYIRTLTEPVIFAEVSQSGEGVHLFIEAPEAPGRKIRDGRNIERYTAGRYIAVTGNRLEPLGASMSQQPSVGRIVHYHSYGTPGGEFKPEARAAVITRVGDDVPDAEYAIPYVDLAVLNPTGMFFNQDVKFSEEAAPGHWSWPPRV